MADGEGGSHPDPTRLDVFVAGLVGAVPIAWSVNQGLACRQPPSPHRHAAGFVDIAAEVGGTAVVLEEGFGKFGE